MCGQVKLSIHHLKSLRREIRGILFWVRFLIALKIKSGFYYPKFGLNIKKVLRFAKFFMKMGKNTPKMETF